MNPPAAPRSNLRDGLQFGEGAVGAVGAAFAAGAALAEGTLAGVGAGLTPGDTGKVTTGPDSGVRTAATVETPYGSCTVGTWPGWAWAPQAKAAMATTAAILSVLFMAVFPESAVGPACNRSFSSFEPVVQYMRKNRPKCELRHAGSARAAALAALAVLLLPLAATAQVPEDGARFTRFLGTRLGAGTLDELPQRFGPAQVLESDDSGDYQARLCYLGAGGVVGFLSGVAQLSLSGYELRETTADAVAGCGELRGRLVEQAGQIGGLRLGMSPADFERVLGGAVRWEGDRGERLYEGEQKITPGERLLFRDSPELLARGTFNVLVSVTGDFVDGRLARVRIWKTVSA